MRLPVGTTSILQQGIPAKRELVNIRMQMEKTAKDNSIKRAKYQQLQQFNGQLASSYVSQLETIKQLTSTMQEYHQMFLSITQQLKQLQTDMDDVYGLTAKDVAYVATLTQSTITNTIDQVRTNIGKLKTPMKENDMQGAWKALDDISKDMLVTHTLAKDVYRQISM